ncbi:Nucleolar protein 12 [Wickerhamomyces ciferrii]|uniref:Nucleolar protein 12 n=1 Tax=Wickerhamomyces ciferrii (strain ATCC 14091 / BCRC 22168 / CBS 111 / JCM 3599 / NBRC 0793 / NRRL Y-1031 F-60-10) TaxID=1206466 RepID=K0KH81_WICCF|nr:Nucleolar protein 12 [Wickerhamomyces ciferrii]CCH40528.1 Nucleolar protein 12 [Wickerhamomyces ciferrii]
MSGISNLFGNSKKDESLLGLFGKSSGPVKRVDAQRTVIKVPESKKIEATEEESEEGSGSEDDSESASGEGSEDQEDSDEEMEDQEEEEPVVEKKKRKTTDEDDDLESKYLGKLLKESETNEAEEEKKAEEEFDSDSDEEDEDKSKDESKPVQSGEVKSIDFKEKEVEKAQRTIFIGNLSAIVIKNKKDYKELKKYFTQFGLIESIRFRSISFNEPIPRKAAFVQQKLHESRDSINAYIVFKEKDAARKSLEANGKVLFDLHLRVDSVSHPSKIDNKRTIFVGNLDFEEKEEELWNIFSECGEIESVRIVRDSTTNMGKGFGYVQFKDFTSVSKALLMNEKKLGEKKRKLRISRSKRVKPTPQQGQNGRGGPRQGQRQGGNNNNNKQRALSNLTDDQKTKLGRAQRVLGKADRSQAGQVVEGQRAKKGDRVTGVKNGKNRVKKPRIRQRSTDFKNLSKK